MKSSDNSANTPLVSVIVTAYNHAEFIEECLRSILMQRVSFSYEVLVGEDCSSDGTADVIRRLRPEFPEYFNFIIREQNLGAVKNGEDLYSRARGKYLAVLEGDDFWISPEKLQDQVDYLEDHPDYSAVYTQCVVVDERSEPNGEVYPQCPFEDYSFKEYFYSRLPGQTGTCVFLRERYLQSRHEFSEVAEYGFYPGDRRNAFINLLDGKVRCMQKECSAYRHVVKRGSSSYSATVEVDDAYARNEILFGKALVSYAKRRCNADAIDTAERTYYRFCLKWALDGRSSVSLFSVLNELLREPRRFRYLLAPIQWYIVLGFRKLRGIAVDL